MSILGFYERGIQMIIDGQYDYWRTMCSALKETLLKDDRFIPKDVLLSRDISPSWFSVTDEMIDELAKSFAEVYLDSDYIELFISMIISSSIYTDLDIARMQRKYGKNLTDRNAAEYAIERMAKLVMKSAYKQKQKQR